MRSAIGNRRRSGQALVEMALVLPVLLGLLCGVIDVGWCMFRHATLSSATREGIRMAAVNTFPFGWTPDQAKGDIKRAIVASAPGLNLTSADITIHLDGNVGPGNRPRVTISARTPHVFFGPLSWAGANGTVLESRYRSVVATWWQNPAPRFSDG